MTLISDYFKDIFIHRVLPLITDRNVHILCCSSKSLCKFVAIQIETDKTDYTLDGRKITTNFDKLDDNTLPFAYLRSKTRQRIFRRHPELMQNLNRASLVITNPKNLISWINHANTHKDSYSLPTATVLFDFDTSLLPAEGNCSLGDSLVKEIWEYPPNVQLIKFILSSHPNSDKIPGAGTYMGHYGLGKALTGATFRVAQNFPDEALVIVRAIFMHENAKDIPAIGTFSLSSGLKNAINTKHTAVAREILQQPNIKKIPPDDTMYGYETLIKKANASKESREIYELLVQTFQPTPLSSPKTPKEN